MPKPTTPDPWNAGFDVHALSRAGFAALCCIDTSEAECEKRWHDAQRFATLAHKYRQRFEQDEIALIHNEAVEAYRLVAPLIEAQSNPLLYSRILITGTLPDGRVHIVPELVLKFLAENEDDACFESKGPWDRYITFEALDYFAKCMERTGAAAVGPAWWKLRDRCRAARKRRPVTRPAGRFDPRTREIRNGSIVVYLRLLEGCGLPVTARNGASSLAMAMSTAFRISERAIRKVWTDSPAPLRDDKHSRNVSGFGEMSGPGDSPAIAPDVPCDQCGRAGKVPVYRTREGGTRLCTDCLPW